MLTHSPTWTIQIPDSNSNASFELPTETTGPSKDDISSFESHLSIAVCHHQKLFHGRDFKILAQVAPFIFWDVLLPIAHTCASSLHLPTTYSTSLELCQEFSELLSSEYSWITDEVKLTLLLVNFIS